MKQIGIIGAGRFGSILAKLLSERGIEVLIMERDKDIVQKVASFAFKVVEGDGTDIRALLEAGFADCETVVVAIGTDVSASILTTMNLQELKIPRIIAKASNDLHAKVLERLGVDLVVDPDRERALRLARSLTARSLIDLFEVSKGTSVAEIPAPQDFVNLTIAESDIRRKYGVTIIAIKRPKKEGKGFDVITNPSGEDKILQGDIIVLYGSDKKIEALCS